jgi:hypothetical protein
MIRSVTSKVMWVGRATVFLVGLAVILALTVGVVSTALAGNGVGADFNLGKTNTVNAVSKLVGSVAGPNLLIDNNSTNTAATALDLQVEAGKAPMKVNSQTKVANLNADTVDGVDSTGFYASGSTVANADKLDGLDSSFFQRVLEAGSTTVDLSSIPGNSCSHQDVDPSGAASVINISNDVVVVTPDGATLPTSDFSVAAAHSDSIDLFRIQLCNQTAGALDPPSTRVDWIVFLK